MESCLVVSTPLKHISQMIIPNLWKNKMFQTTNQRTCSKTTQPVALGFSKQVTDIDLIGVCTKKATNRRAPHLPGASWRPCLSGGKNTGSKDSKGVYPEIYIYIYVI